MTIKEGWNYFLLRRRATATGDPEAVSNRREDRHSYVRTLSSSDRNEQLIRLTSC